MTNSDITAVFKQAIANNLSDMKALPEDLAERYSIWVQQLISNVRNAQAQDQMAATTEQQSAQQNTQQGPQ